MEISELAATDADAAVELWHATGLTRSWNDPHEDLRRALDGTTSAVLGAYVDGHLAGTAMVGHDGHRGWVYYLGVDPAHRRRGLGRALMSACEAWLHGRGVPKLNLMLRGTNAATIAFYDALGYGTDDVIVMSKRLQD